MSSEAAIKFMFAIPATGVCALLSFCVTARGQEPVNPPFQQVEISFRSGPNILKGSLFLPNARVERHKSPYPAIAFVHGSGALDRNDWTLHPELREQLARRGIASLFWDKPGVGASSGDWTQQTFHARAREAIDAIQFLKGHSDVDGKKLGLWGISQGGWICPLAASLSPDVAFIILVSAPAGTIAEQDLYRIEHGMRADKMPEPDIAKSLAFARRRIEFLQSGSYEEFDRAQGKVAEERWLRDYVHRLSVKDFAFAKKNIAYDGRSILKEVKCPVLVLVAERDTIVPAKE